MIFFIHQFGKLCTSTNLEEQLVLRGVPKREDVLKEWKELNSCLSLSFIAKILKKMRLYLEKRKGNLFISWKTKSKDFISSSPSKENCGNFFLSRWRKDGGSYKCTALAWISSYHIRTETRFVLDRKDSWMADLRSCEFITTIDSQYTGQVPVWVKNARKYDWYWPLTGR